MATYEDTPCFVVLSRFFVCPDQNELSTVNDEIATLDKSMKDKFADCYHRSQMLAGHTAVCHLKSFEDRTLIHKWRTLQALANASMQNLPEACGCYYEECMQMLPSKQEFFRIPVPCLSRSSPKTPTTP